MHGIYMQEGGWPPLERMSSGRGQSLEFESSDDCREGAGEGREGGRKKAQVQG